MLLQQVTLLKFSSVDGYGTETYQTPQVINVRLQEVDEIIADLNGLEHKVHSIIYQYTPDLITENDKIITPDGKERQVLKVRSSPSLRGRKTLFKTWLK